MDQDANSLDCTEATPGQHNSLRETPEAFSSDILPELQATGDIASSEGPAP